MGSDIRFPVNMSLHITISIHAPAWGATEKLAETLGYTIISIHAPAWGATICA